MSIPFEYWKMAFYVSSSLFVLCILLLLILRMDKFSVKHSFVKDEFIKRTKNPTSFNDLYLTQGHLKKYIRKYVLCKNAYDRYLICNYVENYQLISYFVVCYNNRKRVIDVILFEEKNPQLSSKIIPLPKNTKYVNIVVKQVNGTYINKSIIKSMSGAKIRFHALLVSLSLLTFLFSGRHLLGQFLAKEYFEGFLKSTNNFIILLATLVVAVFTYFIVVVKTKKRNLETRKGGVIDYEFI